MKYERPMLIKCEPHHIDEGIEAAGVGTIVVSVVVISALIVSGCSDNPP